MSGPLVSVLIPCYNAERHIGETLESVLHQTWPNIETIVVNDGSSDKSSEVIKRFGVNRVTLIEQANQGPGAARNECLRAASGDFIQYLDADDLIARDKIEQQVYRLLQNSYCVASAEWSRFREKVDGARFSPEAVWRDMKPLDWLLESRACGGGMMFPALWLIPRNIINRAGSWRTDLTVFDDTEYFTRLLLNADGVLFCGGARCFYRSGIEGSVSQQKSPKAWASATKALELCESHVRGREDSERVRRCFAAAWQQIAHSCYPYDRVLAEQSLRRASSLHPIRIRPDGGPTFQAVARLIGWRAARRLQVAAGRN